MQGRVTDFRFVVRVDIGTGFDKASGYFDAVHLYRNHKRRSVNVVEPIQRDCAVKVEQQINHWQIGVFDSGVECLRLFVTVCCHQCTAFEQRKGSVYISVRDGMIKQRRSILSKPVRVSALSQCLTR